MRKPGLGLLAGVVVVLALVGVGVGRAAAPRQVARANRALAISVGDGVLRSLALPAGSAPATAEPGGDHGQLARWAYALWYAAEVDRVGFWLTGASPSGVISSIAAHVPAGATMYGHGWSGSPDIDSFESWSLPPIDGGRLGQRLLAVDAVKLANGQTGVRADTWVQYIAPRRAVQRVPAQARILEITITQGMGGGVLSSREVSDRHEVRRIAALVNGLPFAGGPPATFSCPSFSVNTPVDLFQFRATPAAGALATVSLYSDTPDTTDPCATSSLWIRGHRQPPLADGGTLLKRAGAILGIKLTHPTRSTAEPERNRPSASTLASSPSAP